MKNTPKMQTEELKVQFICNVPAESESFFFKSLKWNVTKTQTESKLNELLQLGFYLVL